MLASSLMTIALRVLAVILVACPLTTRAAFDAYTAEIPWRTAVGTFSFDDFESYAVDAQFPDLPHLGVVFAELSGGGFPVIYRHSEPNVTPYGALHLANFPNGINAINRFDSIVLMPRSGFRLTALGFFNGDGQADTMVATAYDSGGAVLGSVGAFKGSFAGFISSAPVAKVVFGGNTGDGWNHIDGLQVNAVPEASTFAMFGAGLLVLGAMIARKRRSESAHSAGTGSTKARDSMQAAPPRS